MLQKRQVCLLVLYLFIQTNRPPVNEDNIIVFLVLGLHKAFSDILGATFRRDQIPADGYENSNFAIALEKEFTVHKISVTESKIQATTKQLTTKEIASNDFFYVAANADIAFILAPPNMSNIFPILPKAKGL